MSLKVAIRALYNSLSKNEKKIADYILTDNHSLQIQTIEDISGSAGTSVASVSRFVRKLGYQSFKQFRIQLVEECSNHVEIDFFYKKINKDDSDREIIEKIFSCNIRSLIDTRKILDARQISRVADLITKAARLIFFGIGSSGHIAREAAMRFSFLEYPAYAFTDPHDIYFHSSGSQKNDVVFGISHTGRTEIMVNAMRIAQGKKAATVGISNSLESPLHKQCSYFFCTAFPENNVTFASLSSLAAQLCIIDALYIICAKEKLSAVDYAQMNDTIEKYLRLK
jgi:DNA-binding MurR/RpiR family transcriptional regulator